jgi:hypothetical protein
MFKIRAILLLFTSSFLFYTANADVTKAEGFLSGKLNKKTSDGKAVAFLNATHFAGEISHEGLPGLPGRRRLLEVIVDTSFNLDGGQAYTATFTGYDCVNFEVTSSGHDVLVNIMEKSDYDVFSSNSFVGSYQYIMGTLCEQTYSCSKTRDGLSKYETYVLMVYNDYEGFSGGASATVTVKMDESGCSSGSSGSPSGSSGSPSGSSGSPSGSSHMGLLGLINTIIAAFVLL